MPTTKDLSPPTKPEGSTTTTKCGVCGEPMPPGEEMFNYHGFSGPCPKPPLPSGNIARPESGYLGREADPEFTGSKLEAFIFDVECAVGDHKAGLTPLGQKIIQICEEAYRRQKPLESLDGA
jgi:hypothetical protein